MSQWPWARPEWRAVCAERCPYGSGRRSAYALLTPFETDQGWLYLSAVMDLYSLRIVGWAMEDHLRAELPLAALRMAISAQRPGAGLIHHSDRGVQYASADYRKLTQSAGFQVSMSRKADCYDNAPMESLPGPCTKPARGSPREAGFKPTWLGECCCAAWLVPDRPTLLAPTKDALANTPQAPAAHIFLS
jgi:transposase InsO family protein